MLHATQPVEKKQQGSRREGRRKQRAGDQCATWLLSALLLPGVWTEVSMARRLGRNSHKVLTLINSSLALLGPALCQRTSPFLPCGDGVRSPTSIVGSAHMKYINLLSAPHLTLHLTQSPGLEKESGIRDHSVFFIRRNSSLSRKILHKESVVDF